MSRASSLLTALVVLCSSCGAVEGPVLSEADSGSELRLLSGDEFVLELGSNPSTGYSWVVADDSVVMVDLIDERLDEPDTDLVGVSGIQHFVFEAVERGAGVLRLEYVRPFEDPSIPQKVFELVVVVDEAEWPPGISSTPPGTSRATAPES